MSERFIAHDAAFADVTGRWPRLELVAVCDAHEGPVYVAAEDSLYATSVAAPGPASVIKRIRLDGARFPVGPDRIDALTTSATMPNGMTSDLDGRLVVCEQGDHDHPACISRIDPATGERIVVVSEWRGRRLNSPNDVVTAADGAIWFTDPTYGHLQGFRPAPELGAFVYRWDPVTGTVDVVADGFDQPNGIALAPDGSTLYVTDSGANQAAGSFHVDRPHHVVAFEVVAGRRLAGRRLLAVTAPGFPDGLKVDAAGRVYVSASSGVLVYSPDGDLVGEIWVPGAVNFTFGGADRDVLFITADTAVWAARLAATGPVAVPARAVPSHPHPVRSPVMTRPTRTRLSLDGASVEAVATAAEKYATERGHRVVIAVVDAGGNLLHLRHTAGAQVASSRVAVDKARTAAIFVRPSRDLEAQVSSGRLGALALHGAAALTGGVPLVVDGQVVGAIGTSGETPDEDEAVSLAGAAVALPRIEIAALTFAGARLAAEAAGAGSARRGVAPVVAVVDAGGELVYVHRPDAAQVASVGVATDKARTAAIYRRPSKDFEDQASGGRPSALHLHGAVPLQGGIPLVVDGTVVGAIGVSGASSADEDQELALLGAEVFDVAVAVVPRATRVDAAAMDDGFAVGRLVVETDGYQVDAARRTGAGTTEVHEQVTDVMYVLAGRATVVTGEGTDSITSELAPGDLFVIPATVPHTFTSVSDPFRYLVVKVAG